MTEMREAGNFCFRNFVETNNVQGTGLGVDGQRKEETSVCPGRRMLSTTMVGQSRAKLLSVTPHSL